ncbi:MAG: hypothetical protein PW792_09860 [Acidobacteriaceae bacterium]|nr:hypothetical protein [Acidobacteriaceae bacterium]
MPLSAILAVGITIPAAAQTPCHLEEAQQLYAQPSWSYSAIETLLANCRDLAATDYRIPLLQGVILRDQGHLDEAIVLLESAHSIAPELAAPTLELAVTEERKGRPQAARSLYKQVLTHDEHSRPALLGLARADRAEYRFSEARGIYQKFLQQSPADADALNGMAWIALSNRRTASARTGFHAALAAQPDNLEAKAGLKHLDQSWRYQLDLVGGAVHSSSGTAGLGGVDVQMYLNALNTIEVGNTYNSSELPVTLITQTTQLPTDNVRLGYFYRVPDGVNASLTYDYRHHLNLPDEHWLAANVGNYIGKGVQWFAGARGAFGAPQWNNLLLQGGLIAPLGHSWQLVGTGYFDEAKISHGPQNQFSNSAAFVADLNRQGPGRLFLNIGTGYNPTVSAFDIHARATVPLTRHTALLGMVDHVTTSSLTQATVGLRFNW